MEGLKESDVIHMKLSSDLKLINIILGIQGLLITNYKSMSCGIHHLRYTILLQSLGHSSTHGCCYCTEITGRAKNAYASSDVEERSIGTLKRDYNNFIDPSKGNRRKDKAKFYNNVVDEPLINAPDEKKVSCMLN